MYKLLLCWRYLRTRYIALASIISIVLLLYATSSKSAGIDAANNDRDEANQPSPAISKTEQTDRSIRKPNDVQRILAPRELEVEILEPATSDDINQILAKMKKSAMENPTWIQDHVKNNARPGQPLPYHEKLGVTKDEYQRFLKFADNAKLIPIARGKLRFEAQPNNQIIIHDVEGLQEFDGVVVDTTNQRVITPWGIVPLRPIHAGEKSGFGAWDGLTGRLQSGSAESGSVSVVRASIGQQSKTGLHIFNLSARVVENGVKTVSIEKSIRFR